MTARHGRRVDEHLVGVPQAGDLVFLTRSLVLTAGLAALG